MRALYLIRHGETAWNAEHRLQGRRDIPLSPTGARQARALRSTVSAILDDGGPGRVTVVTSPLARARETCALLGLEPDVVDERWQEAELGQWTGRTREELLAAGDGAYAAWRAGTFSPPGSESPAAMRDRVGKALVALEDHELVVVVTHGGPIRSTCRQLVGLEPDRLVPVQPGSLTAFDLSADRPRLRVFNLTPLASQELLHEPPD